jgi:hypothetical protein
LAGRLAISVPENLSPQRRKERKGNSDNRENGSSGSTHGWPILATKAGLVNCRLFLPIYSPFFAFFASLR